MNRLYDEEIKINALDWNYFTVAPGQLKQEKPRRPKRMTPNN